jgi:glycopeptide antibiotics resistance protein
VISGSVIWIAWPVIAGLVVFWQVRRHARWPQILGAVGLATYAWWICSVAFFPLPLGDSAVASAGEFAGRDWVNLVPLRELFRALPQLGSAQIVREFGGNILLLVPFTLFGPLLWARLRTWWWPLAAGLGGSVAIELIQLALSGLVGYPYRQTDVDDVILNAFGAFLGYAVFLTVRALARRVTRRAAAGAPQN